MLKRRKRLKSMRFESLSMGSKHNLKYRVPEHAEGIKKAFLSTTDSAPLSLRYKAPREGRFSFPPFDKFRDPFFIPFNFLP